IIRLMGTDATLPTVRGGGTYYSFARQDHEYNYGSDIRFDGQNQKFSVGFAGLDYGFFSNLGQVDLDNVSIASPGVTYASEYQPPNGSPCEGAQGSMRAEQTRIYDAQGAFTTVDGYAYQSQIDVKVGSTYVVRSLNVSDSDVLIAFRVVR